MLLALAANGVSSSLTLWYYLAGIAAGLGAVGLFLKWIWSTVRPPVKSHLQFLEDWHGEDARPGVPAKPGMMVRVQNLEDVVEHLKAEVTLNHGGSMKDQVVAMRKQIDSIQKKINS